MTSNNAAGARKGPWWVTNFVAQGRKYVIRFKLGDDGMPGRIELCSSNCAAPPRRAMRLTAERFCRDHADIITDAVALRDGVVPQAGPYAPEERP